MLRIHTILFPVLAAALCFNPAAASAQGQSVSGKITEINQKNNTVTIEPTSKESGLPDKIELFMKPGANLKGIDSIQDLNVGDEVRFEAQQQNTWFADSLETTAVEAKERSEAPEADKDYASGKEDKNVFQRAWGNIRSAWFSFRGEVGTTPELYTKYAEKTISSAEGHLKDLKSKASDPAALREYESESAQRPVSVDTGEAVEERREAARDIDAAPASGDEAENTAERRQELLADAEAKLASARGELASLKEIPAHFEGIYSTQREADAAAEQAGEEISANRKKALTEDWRDAKKETDEALKDLKQSVQKAAGAILPQKERYEIASRYDLEEMRYDLEELKAAADVRGKTENREINSRIQELEQTLDKADANHQKLESAGKENWKASQDQLQTNFDSFRSVYSDVVGKLAA